MNDYLTLLKNRLKIAMKMEKIQGEITVVWYAKELKNAKGVFLVGNDFNTLYEVSYNGENRDTYINIYSKKKNLVVESGVM